MLVDLREVKIFVISSDPEIKRYNENEFKRVGLTPIFVETLDTEPPFIVFKGKVTFWHSRVKFDFPDSTDIVYLGCSHQDKNILVYEPLTDLYGKVSGITSDYAVLYLSQKSQNIIILRNPLVYQDNKVTPIELALVNPEARNVFLYWVGPVPKLIKIFRKLIYLHSTNGKGYNVHLITRGNLGKYIGEVPNCFDSLLPAHQADLVRVYALFRFGGIWLDSDTLVMDSLDPLFEHIEKGDGFLVLEDRQLLFNGVFGTQAKTPFMGEWKRRLIQVLESKGNNIRWTEIGNIMMQRIYQTYPDFLKNYKIYDGLENLYPVNWNRCVEEYVEKPYENYKNIRREFQPLIIMIRTVYNRVETWDEEEIINGNSTLSYLIRKSSEHFSDTKAKRSSPLDLRQIKIFVINLPESKERQKHVISEFERVKLTPTFIEGIKDIGPRGCARSHLKILSTTKPPFIIFEDDISFWHFNQEFDFPDSTDAVYLGASSYRREDLPNKEGIFYTPLTETYGKISKMLATHGILYLSQRYINHTIEMCNKTIKSNIHFDVHLASSQDRFNVLALKKPMVYQDSRVGGHEYCTKVVLNDFVTIREKNL